jgi:hypothetical protein
MADTADSAKGSLDTSLFFLALLIVSSTCQNSSPAFEPLP